MNDKFKNKYRIQSNRLQNYDYGQDGAYFITICTKDRKHYFGKIIDGKMQYSKIGIIADILWNEILHHSKNMTLGEFIIMPNHIHGILIIDGRNKACLVSTTNANHKNIGKNRFQNQGKNTISSIIGSYKSAVTKHLNRLNFDFAWQPLFYDHIIRNERSYQKISRYILNNPLNWQKDELYE